MMPAPLLNREDYAPHIFGYVIGLVLTGTSEAGLLSGENGFKVVYLQVVKGGGYLFGLAMLDIASLVRTQLSLPISRYKNLN